MSTYTIPNVIDRRPNGERITDVYSHLLSERVVYLGTAIDAGVANAIVAQLLFLASDEAVAENYRAAHRHYLESRNALEDLGTDFTGGGMPDRVKCLHVLIAYALAEGPGVVRLGDEAVALAAAAGLRGSAIPAGWPEPQFPWGGE